MKLSQDSYLVRWAYLRFWPFTANALDMPDERPQQVSLCILFWRTLFAPLLMIILILFLAPFFFLGVMVSLGYNWIRPSLEGIHAPSLLVTYIRAKKRGICPIIELVSEDGHDSLDDWNGWPPR